LSLKKKKEFSETRLTSLCYYNDVRFRRNGGASRKQKKTKIVYDDFARQPFDTSAFLAGLLKSVEEALATHNGRARVNGA
jgi:hypothetical protein